MNMDGNPDRGPKLGTTNIDTHASMLQHLQALQDTQAQLNYINPFPLLGMGSAGNMDGYGLGMGLGMGTVAYNNGLGLNNAYNPLINNSQNQFLSQMGISTLLTPQNLFQSVSLT